MYFDSDTIQGEYTKALLVTGVSEVSECNSLFDFYTSIIWSFACQHWGELYGLKVCKPSKFYSVTRVLGNPAVQIKRYMLIQYTHTHTNVHTRVLTYSGSNTLTCLMCVSLPFWWLANIAIWNRKAFTGLDVETMYKLPSQSLVSQLYFHTYHVSVHVNVRTLRTFQGSKKKKKKSRVARLKVFWKVGGHPASWMNPGFDPHWCSIMYWCSCLTFRLCLLHQCPPTLRALPILLLLFAVCINETIILL